MMKLHGFFTGLLLCISILSTFSQTVYITKTGTKYHKDGCGSLSRSKFAIDLVDAISRGYGPCGNCKPSSSTNSLTTPSNTEKYGAKQQVNSTNTVANQQCSAITKAGTRCSRKADAGSKYCWQHKK